MDRFEGLTCELPLGIGATVTGEIVGLPGSWALTATGGAVGAVEVDSADAAEGCSSVVISSTIIWEKIDQRMEVLCLVCITPLTADVSGEDGGITLAEVDANIKSM